MIRLDQKKKEGGGGGWERYFFYLKLDNSTGVEISMKDSQLHFHLE